jgi:hypothetical protein
MRKKGAAEDVGVVREQDSEGEIRVYGPEAPQSRKSNPYRGDTWDYWLWELDQIKVDGC